MISIKCDTKSEVLKVLLKLIDKDVHLFNMERPHHHKEAYYGYVQDAISMTDEIKWRENPLYVWVEKAHSPSLVIQLRWSNVKPDGDCRLCSDLCDKDINDLIAGMD